MRILIADDESNNRILMHKYLQSWGQCDLVQDGSEAVEAFQIATDEGSPYDLICMDQFMDEMNGDEALKAIRTIENQWGIDPNFRTFVIIISGDSTPIQDTSLLESDACLLTLPKPITQTQLYATLQKNGFFPPEESSTSSMLLSTAQNFPQIPGLDRDSGLDRVMGNAPLYLELLGNFLHTHEADMASLQTALDADSRDIILRILHKIKGSSGNISANRVHFAAKALEDAFRRDIPLAQRTPLLAEFFAAMNELLTGLRLLDTHANRD
ncbi:MAG: Hpt domain-containing protein [Magnetococcales bacterium]|nr:Hpt domain-containing protein [Magnetococcales bacterium]MBF0437558.1 Hpt domain-containing protein [Magnetococcales bacterium]